MSFAGDWMFEYRQRDWLPFNAPENDAFNEAIEKGDSVIEFTRWWGKKGARVNVSTPTCCAFFHFLAIGPSGFQGTFPHIPDFPVVHFCTIMIMRASIRQMDKAKKKTTVQRRKLEEQNKKTMSPNFGHMPRAPANSQWHAAQQGRVFDFGRFQLLHFQFGEQSAF